MINHELWRVVASGVLSEMITRMQTAAGESLDKLKQLNEQKAFTFWAKVQFSSSLGFAFSESTRGLLWDEVADPNYAPVLREQANPMVAGATVTGGNTLAADDAPENYATHVYQFNGLTFAELGSLADNSQPGAGNYVLANVLTEDSTTRSLPSGFLTLTS